MSNSEIGTRTGTRIEAAQHQQQCVVSQPLVCAWVFCRVPAMICSRVRGAVHPQSSVRGLLVVVASVLQLCSIQHRQNCSRGEYKSTPLATQAYRAFVAWYQYASTLSQLFGTGTLVDETDPTATVYQS